MTAIEFYAKIAGNIARFGLHIMHVFPRADGSDGGGQPFSYTIGLSEKFGHELLATGLPPEVAHGVLNAIAETMKRDIRLPRDEPLLSADDAHPERLNHWANTAVVFKDCKHPDLYQKYAVQAQRYYRADVPVVQMVWPDPAGAFPWQPEADPEWVARQPLLFTFN
jgi:hypothetical protein